MIVDPEFQFLEEKVVSTTLNTTGVFDYVPEVERHIQFIKERMGAHHANLPFPSFTRRITIYLANHVMVFLNALPPNSGLPKIYRPRTIITGKALYWKKIC